MGTSNIEEKSKIEGYVTFIDDDDYTPCQWLDAIIGGEVLYADLCDDTIYENIYYFPSFIPTIKKNYCRIPLWTNLMLPFHKKMNDSASSSNVESYFKNIKQLLLNTGSGLLRVDDFIMKHTDYISGEIKLAQCSSKNNISTLETSENKQLKTLNKLNKLTGQETNHDVNFKKE